MVRTIVLAGVARPWAGEDEVSTIVVTTAGEALDIVERRSCDAIAVGCVPDMSSTDLIDRLHTRHALIPVVMVTDGSDGPHVGVWECAPASSADRIADALRRAAEVGWLRRENQRLTRPSPDVKEGPRELEVAFEKGSIREMERLMIVGRLERLNQNRTRSAESLDISVRTLRNKLREYRTRMGSAAARELTSLTD